MRFERRIYDFVELIKIIEDKNIEDIRIISPNFKITNFITNKISNKNGILISFDYIDRCDKCGAILK